MLEACGLESSQHVPTAGLVTLLAPSHEIRPIQRQEIWLLNSNNLGDGNRKRLWARLGTTYFLRYHQGAHAYSPGLNVHADGLVDPALKVSLERRRDQFWPQRGPRQVLATYGRTHPALERY